MISADSIQSLYSTRLSSLLDTQGQTQATGQSTASFQDILSAYNTATGSTGTAFINQEEYASRLEQDLLEDISQRIGDAPNYLYAFHPAVFEKMSTDPEFMEKMVGVVDEWTSSGMFQSAKSGQAYNTMLLGESGDYAMASTLMDGIGGSSSILDFVVSSNSLLTEDGFSNFASQFGDLPQGTLQPLIQNLDLAQMGSAGGNAYYEAMSATAEVQKRLLTDT